MKRHVQWRTIREWSEHDPNMNSPFRAGLFAELTFHTLQTHFVWKNATFALRLSTRTSPNAAPATKSDAPTSPKVAPATESDAPTSPDVAPAMKSQTPTSANELLLD